MDSVLFYVVTFLFILFGLVAIIKPEQVWKIEHIFTLRKGEPSDLYLTLSRLSGILIIAIGVFRLISSMIN